MGKVVSIAPPNESPILYELRRLDKKRAERAIKAYRERMLEKVKNDLKQKSLSGN